MAREQVNGGDITYYKASTMAVGQTVIGKFIKASTDQFDNPCYHLRGIDGKRMVLNYCTSLERAMENVSVGDVLDVVYQGTKKLEKGPFAGKDAHRFEVYKLTGQDIPAFAEVAPEESKEDWPL